MEAIRESYARGYCNFTDGQYFGEAIGEKIQSNKYNLQGNIWLPYDTIIKDTLSFNSWGKFPKTYEAISDWFENYLISLFYKSRNKGEQGFVEGVVFCHPDGRLAKLRRDMFPWYRGQKHKKYNK